jgi:hypothetical protein
MQEVAQVCGLGHCIVIALYFDYCQGFIKAVIVVSMNLIMDLGDSQDCQSLHGGECHVLWL